MRYDKKRILYNYIIENCPYDVLKIFMDHDLVLEKLWDINYSLFMQYKNNIIPTQLTRVYDKVIKRNTHLIHIKLKHCYFKPELNGIKGGPGYYKLLDKLNE